MDREPDAEWGIPALPGKDPALGEIRWGRWEEALLLSHIPSHCETCDYPGPLRTAMGKTWYVPPTVAAPLRRRKPGELREWGSVKHPAHWCYSHWARRCPRCEEMVVWRTQAAGGKSTWTEIHYRPPRVERRAQPQAETLF